MGAWLLGAVSSVRSVSGTVERAVSDSLKREVASCEGSGEGAAVLVSGSGWSASASPACCSRLGCSAASSGAASDASGLSAAGSAAPSSGAGVPSSAAATAGSSCGCSAVMSACSSAGGSAGCSASAVALAPAHGKGVSVCPLTAVQTTEPAGADLSALPPWLGPCQRPSWAPCVRRRLLLDCVPAAAPGWL